MKKWLLSGSNPMAASAALRGDYEAVGALMRDEELMNI